MENKEASAPAAVENKEASAQAAMENKEASAAQGTPPAAVDAVQEAVKAFKPKAAQEQLKLDTVKKRLGRLFAPRADGTYLMDKKLVDMWHNPSTKDSVIEEFHKSGYDKVGLV